MSLTGRDTQMEIQGSLAGKNRIREIVERVERMPPLAPTVARIMEIADSANADPRDLNKVITMDPVLTGRVLKLVNSAYFGLGTKVTQIIRAIVLLGLNTIKNLALSTAVLGTYSGSERPSGLDMDLFWEHSLAVATYSKLCAMKMGVDQSLQEEYFAAGLLHDLGKVVFDSQIPEEFSRSLKVARLGGLSLLDAENRTLLVSHSEAGAWLAGKWSFTPALIAVAGQHHNPPTSGEHAKLVHTVHLGNVVAKSMRLGFSGSDRLEQVNPSTWEILGLSPDDSRKMTVKLLPEIQKARAFLKVNKGQSI